MPSRRLLTILAGLAVLLPAAAAAEPVGFVAAVRGYAEMGGGEGGFTMAAIDRDVSVGDVVRTRPHAWLKMLLADDTLLAVDAGSELRVDRFAGRGTDTTRVSLSRGHVRTKLVDGFGRRVHLEMATPHATIEARGTEWLTWLDEDATWVCTVSGEVRVRAGGAALDVAPGDCARAGGGLSRASRPRHLRAVAMRPGAVKDAPAFPAKAAAAELGEADPVVIDVNDLLRKRNRETGNGDRSPASAGRPPASAAIP